MVIGNKLKSLRAAKGFSPDFVADKLGISKSTYGRYERDETMPDLKVLSNIAQLYEIEVYELLSEEKIIFTQNNNKGSNNGFVINQLSEKLIEQFEIRLQEKETIIKEKNKIISELEQELQAIKDKK